MAKQKIQPINGKITIPKLDRMKPTFDFMSETTKYENILFELYATQIEWDGLPEEIKRDGGELYLEKTICNEGKCLFFYDDILKEYLVHSFTGSGFNFYGQPLKYYVKAANGYSREFDRTNAVPIYNSPYYTTEVNVINNFAQKLALCDLTIMVNTQTQKTPYLIKCSETQRLTLLNVFKEINEFNPKIFVDETYDADSITVYPLNAPFISNEVYDLKAKYWQEALRFCGISTGTVKKERVGTEEQQDAQDEANAMLNTRLASRKIAAKQIKEMFGIELTPKLRKAEELEQMTMKLETLTNGNKKTEEVEEDG